MAEASDTETTTAMAAFREKIRQPSSARVWNWLLGGKDHFAADRHCLGQLPQLLDILRQLAGQHEEFRKHAVTLLATEGIDQFIDCGPGLPPTGGSTTYEIACQTNPEVRVVYVDHDPMVLSWRRGEPLGGCEENLLSPLQPLTIEADIFDPLSILEHPETKAYLDWSRPVGVIHTATWQHFDGDPGEAADRMKAFVTELAPGSYTVITGFISNRLPQTLRSEFEAHLLGGPVIARWFSRSDELEALFPEQELIGFGPCLEWISEAKPSRHDPAPYYCLLGGIGRVGPGATPNSGGTKTTSSSSDTTQPLREAPAEPVPSAPDTCDAVDESQQLSVSKRSGPPGRRHRGEPPAPVQSITVTRREVTTDTGKERTILLDRLDPPLPLKWRRPLLRDGYRTLAKVESASDGQLVKIARMTPPPYAACEQHTKRSGSGPKTGRSTWRRCAPNPASRQGRCGNSTTPVCELLKWSRPPTTSCGTCAARPG